MQITTIKAGITFFEFEVDPHTTFGKMIRLFVKQYLTEFDYNYRFKRWQITRTHITYNKNTRKLRMPINFLPSFKDFLTGCSYEYELINYPTYKARKVNLKLRDNFRLREEQTGAVSFLANPSINRKGLNLSTGCLIGSTVINFNRAKKGFKTTLKKAYLRYNQLDKHPTNKWDQNIPTYVRSLKHRHILLHSIQNIVYSGKKKVYKMTLENGLNITGTIDHEIHTDKGFVELGKCKNKRITCDTLNAISHNNDSGPKFRDTHLIVSENHPYSRPKYSKCIKIEYIGVEDTYDIVCDDPYRNFVANGIVVHNCGKTATSIASMVKYNTCTMIIVSGLVEQWVNEIDKFTENREDTYVIQGVNSIKRLLKSDYKPSIFVCSIDTLRPYILNKPNYKKFISFDKFLKRYGVGLKIMDEVHLKFAATVLVDLNSNVEQNVYLTATFDVTNKGTRKIFKRIYPDELQYSVGSENYTAVYGYRYISGVPEHACMTPRGYSHAKFEKHLVKRITKITRFVNQYLIAIIDNHFIKRRDKGEKCLIYFSTLAMIDVVKGLLEAHYPNEKIVTYTTEDPEEHLDDGNDIILTTHKSAGTGTDISKLRIVINTVSIQSQVLTRQILGRLRRLPSGNTPEFICMYDAAINAHCRHYTERRHIYNTAGLTLTEIDL